MTTDSASRPDPGDANFFARFTLSRDILDAAFGPEGGTPPPTVQPASSTRGSNERADSSFADRSR